jgi:hypothetical protein
MLVLTRITLYIDVFIELIKVVADFLFLLTAYQEQQANNINGDLKAINFASVILTCVLMGGFILKSLAKKKMMRHRTKIFGDPNIDT